MRFDPPPAHLTRELGWVLLRAFGPVAAPPPRPLDGRRAVELARLYNAGGRIGGRFAPAVLADEVGAEPAADLRRLYVATAERAVVLAGLARHVGAAAAAIGQQVALLKSTALHAAGITPPGWRPAVDVDVLARRDGAAALHAELERRGFTPLGIADTEHHLQPLRHACGRSVEIHPSLEGVGGGRGLDAGDLVRLGRAAAVPWLPGTLLPDRETIAAHLLVHAIALHGARPREYALMRVIGDLVDLLPHAAAWQRFEERGAPLLDGAVDADEWMAARALTLALASGRVPAGERWTVDEGAAAVCTGEPGAETLLRHLLAGAADRDYADSLRLVSFLRRPGEGPAAAALLRRAWRTVFLSRAQVDEIYGAPRSAMGYLVRRLWRPFDLLVRAAGAVLARRRLRRARTR